MRERATKVDLGFQRAKILKLSDASLVCLVKACIICFFWFVSAKHSKLYEIEQLDTHYCFVNHLRSVCPGVFFLQALAYLAWRAGCDMGIPNEFLGLHLAVA